MLSASSRPTGYRRRASLDQVDDGRAAVRVARGRDDPGGLVERVDDALLDAGERAAVELDALAVDLARRIELAHAVDAHAPGAHDLGGGAPRGDAGVGEVLGKAHRLQP